MSIWAQVKTSVVTVTLLMAMPLAAQRYPERDHHVFHPPAAAKHQGMPSTGNAVPTRVSSVGNSSTSRGHDPNLTVSRNDPAHPQIQSNQDPVHPH
jgi:hypothetical protein